MHRPPHRLCGPAAGGTPPSRNAAVGETVTVRGRAQVVTYPSWFEAALVDGRSGQILVHEIVRAACGADCWLPPGGGEFRFTLSVPGDVDRSSLWLRVWTPSPDENLIADVL